MARLAVKACGALLKGIWVFLEAVLEAYKGLLEGLFRYPKGVHIGRDFGLLLTKVWVPERGSNGAYLRAIEKPLKDPKRGSLGRLGEAPVEVPKRGLEGVSTKV